MSATSISHQHSGPNRRKIRHLYKTTGGPNKPTVRGRYYVIAALSATPPTCARTLSITSLVSMAIVGRHHRTSGCDRGVVGKGRRPRPSCHARPRLCVSAPPSVTYCRLHPGDRDRDGMAKGQKGSSAKVGDTCQGDRWWDFRILGKSEFGIFSPFRPFAIFAIRPLLFGYSTPPG